MWKLLRSLGLGLQPQLYRHKTKLKLFAEKIDCDCNEQELSLMYPLIPLL